MSQELSTQLKMRALKYRENRGDAPLVVNDIQLAFGAGVIAKEEDLMSTSAPQSLKPMENQDRESWYYSTVYWLTEYRRKFDELKGLETDVDELIQAAERIAFKDHKLKLALANLKTKREAQV